MSQKELNLGILAHVDAGKTTLTERLLYDAGVIRELGSVDAGTTQTDSLALERQRGITIRAAVASFAIGDLHVNLIDTPGHPDFIAEVERVLSVLDGAVLVISAVEGVQPQTRILMRALQRLGVPTLLFVNKIDRVGADDARVMRAIGERLSPAVVRMGAPRALGTREAEFVPFAPDDDVFRAQLAEALAEHDDAILAAYVEEDVALGAGLREALAEQTRRGLVHPLIFGSALTGAGIRDLRTAVGELLPGAEGDAAAPVAGRVFKIERGPAGDKIAYVRLFSGTIRARDRVRFGSGAEGKVTAVAVFERGGAVQRPAVAAGGVAKLWGLAEVQVGDRVGEPAADDPPHPFPPPTLESVAVACDPGDRARLRVALAQLAEQDPLIDVRQSAAGELSVSLYGEVQKEVVEATLAGEYGIEVEFREATPIHVERPRGTGEAVEVLHGETNPFDATIGLRVEAAPEGAGFEFRLDVETGAIPLHLYKTRDGFAEQMAGYVRRTLREGLFGWEVTDCVVTMTRCFYATADGPPSQRGSSTPGDFRKLAPMVVMQALERAGTIVCAPMARVALEIPHASLGSVMPALVRLGATVETPSARADLFEIETVLPAASVSDLQRQLPRLTGGEGGLEATFAGYRPVVGDPPTRPRTRANPLNRNEYLLELAHRAIRSAE